MTLPELPQDIGRILVQDHDTAPFLVDWRGRYHGRARAVVQPESTTQVATLVRWCAAHRVALVPQGGNTGLTGASVPDECGTALVISLTRMHRIRAIDPHNNTLTVEAGARLQDVHDAAAACDRLFPLSLAAQGQCTIGGNLATNAGGTAVLRYGNARELCLGLEVVTAQGEIWDGLSGLRKDNTGYALRDLLIGSEGTLGIMTAATLKLFPRPIAQITALAALPHPKAALDLLMATQARLGPCLTTFELISGPCLHLVTTQFPQRGLPLKPVPAWAVLLELSVFEDLAHAHASVEAVLTQAHSSGLITDAAVAQSLSQAQSFWQIRECISEAQTRVGPNIKHDLAVPISAIPDFIHTTEHALRQSFPGVQPIVFGHMGDGNLHFNVNPPPGTDQKGFRTLEPAVHALVHDAVLRVGGSISAEHGIGVLRRDALAQHACPVKMALMHRIKQALDPLGIMNPGKVLAPPA
jgi:FAD/FMN-containing dehydrogenase